MNIWQLGGVAGRAKVSVVVACLLNLNSLLAQVEIQPASSAGLSGAEGASRQKIIEATKANASAMASIHLRLPIGVDFLPMAQKPALLTAFKETPSIRFDNGSGHELVLTQLETKGDPYGVVTWSARVTDSTTGGTGTALLAAQSDGDNGAFITGVVNIGTETLELHPVSGTNFIVLSGVQYPPEHGPISPAVAKRSWLNRLTLDSRAKAVVPPQSPSLIKILFAYTRAAASATNVPAAIRIAVETANESFQGELGDDHGAYASQREVHAFLTNVMEVEVTNYVESGSIDKDLARFQDPNDGYMDEIHRIRDKCEADICVLIVEGKDGDPGYNLCGKAASIYATPSTAFCVVREKCVIGNYTIAHEIGHLLGARHNTQIDPNTFPFSYGHGIYWTNNWRSIMAYMNTIDDLKTRRVIIWSSPIGDFDKFPLGIQRLE